ncbi:transmembrane protein 70 homolog, mitochondrial [Nomia melanderi]|uniref:transmembrane protein 70 homolog, mitochondrial n=1 Tax=Nomia melanderi TaxID=2448451 RepID=UPI0013041F6A|nr:transmembrane protein 70 homolog, mitochondrial [Nomia melanderi]XP_031835162.1 transmembrane protein 70 homolog, mitochondrial [Nomia melanderi]
MSVALRHCILIQRKICFQKFASQRCTTPFLFNICNNKVTPGNLQVKYFYTEGNNYGDNQLIYTGKLNWKLYYVKAFSLSTSFVSIGFAPIVYMHSMESDNPIVTLTVSVIMFIYLTATPLLLHHILGRKYAFHIYFNSQKKRYIAETYSLFLKKLQTEFTEDDVHVPDITGPFTTCVVKGKPLFFNEAEFTEQVHYHNIMGHYKPLDLFCTDDKDKMKDVRNNDKK